MIEGLMQREFTVYGGELLLTVVVAVLVGVWIVALIASLRKVESSRRTILITAAKRIDWWRAAASFAAERCGVSFTGTIYEDDPSDPAHWHTQTRDMPAGAPVLRVPGRTSADALRERLRSRHSNN